MISSQSRARMRVLSFLSTLVLLTLAAPAIAANSNPDDTSQKPRTLTKRPVFPDRPSDVDTRNWTRLETAVQEAKLLPRPNGVDGPFGEFGYSVSVDGDRALVGGPGLVGSGAVLVLINTGSSWQEAAVLRPSDGETNDHFGNSVSLSGDRALVGAAHGDDNGTRSGAAYVFEFNGTNWSETDKLTPADGAAYDYFGSSVSLVGDHVLVGAVHDDDNGENSGAAYVFEFNGTNWSETDKLTPADGSRGDKFGSSISLSGDRALVGAYGDSGSESSSGSAYVFDFDGSSWSEANKLEPAGSSWYGEFGISVSLSGDRALVGTDSESAYVFESTGSSWSETAKLTAEDDSGHNDFGRSVSLSGDRALVGAHYDDDIDTVSGAAYVFDFDGTSWNQIDKLKATDAGFLSKFGFSVSLSGDRALVGARQDDDDGYDSGSAYVFDFNGTSWSETDKLTPAEGSGYDWFGYSISLSGDRALVGARNDNDNGDDSGSTYVFEFDGTDWSETAKLKPVDGSADDRFGASVSLSGTRALIGAYLDDDNGNNSGAAYVFDFDGTDWNETAKLTPADGSGQDWFGNSVSLVGDRALVGALRDNDNGNNSGAAYVFDFNGTAWSETAKLTPAEGAAYDEFGGSVSLSGDRALVGARRDDDNGSSSGSAYVFDFNGTSWSETAKLTPADGGSSEEFGASVSLSGDRALVGAPGHDGGTTGFSGSAYVFDFNGTSWSETDKLTPADGASKDLFGYSVSLSGDWALVGAYGDDDNRGNSGSAYLFDFDGTVWTETEKLLAPDGKEGDWLGFSVSLSGERALVGASRDDDNGLNSGSVYVFRDNQAPVAKPDAVTTDEVTALNGNVLYDNGNGVDHDADGDLLTVIEANGADDDVGTQITLASGALVTISASGNFTYDPNGQFDSLEAGETATDSFDYTISDGFVSDSATVTVTINGVSRIFWDSFGN